MQFANNSRRRGRASIARRSISVAVCAASILVGLTPSASAETYGNGGPVAVGTNGSSASGQLVTVTDSGTAASHCYNVAVGCVAGVAVSGTGSANGIVAVSGTGNAGWDGYWLGRPSVAVSGTGAAKASTVAVSGTGAADQRTTNGCPASTSPTAGVAVSGIGEASGCTAADAALTWVDTPDGPVAVGSKIGTITALVKATVAGVQDVVEEESHTLVELAHEYIPPDPVSDTDGFIAWLPGMEAGITNYETGCAANATCNGLRIERRHRMPVDYYHPSYGFRMFHGIVVGSYMVPSSTPSDGYSYDAFHVFTTFTGDESGICGINNYAKEEGGNEAFYTMGPVGTQDVGSGQNVGFGVSVGPFSFNTSWTSYSGRIRGDYDPSEAKATGSWTYRKNNCPWNGNSATMASGASYEWPRGVGRSYELGTVMYYQIR